MVLPLSWTGIINGRHEPRQGNICNQAFLVRHCTSQLKQTQHDSIELINIQRVIVHRNITNFNLARTNFKAGLQYNAVPNTVQLWIR